jgi:hypothetical protein
VSSANAQPDVRSYGRKLRQIADAFRSGLLPNTAKWLENRASDIENRQLSTSWESDYLSAYAAFRSEFSQEKQKPEKLFDEVQRILGPSKVNTPPLSLDKLLKITEESQPIVRTIVQVLDVFGPSQASIEQQFYGLCFVYLMLTEDVLRDVLRFFYAWIENSEGRVANVQDIVTVTEAKQKLEGTNIDPILFDGYEDGHLRNSIAHGRYSFDDSTRLIHFTDINPKTKKKTYDKTVPLSEFRERADMVYFVIFLVRPIIDMRIVVPRMFEAVSVISQNLTK